MDFFVQNLVGENCLVVPPVSLISRAIHYLYISNLGIPTGKKHSTQITPGHDIHDFKSIIHEMFLNKLIEN